MVCGFEVRRLGSLGTIQHRSLVLADREYHHALRMRLLLDTRVSNDLVPVPNRCRCRVWRDRPNETLHVLDKKDRTRHKAEYHACRDVLFHVMRKKLQGITMIQTERVLDGQEDVEDFAARLRADIVVRWMDGAGVQHERIVDVAVDNPAAPTYRTRHANDVRNPPRSYLGGALAREREKELKYARLQLGGRFVPFAIDATGRVGPMARRFVEEMFSVDETTEVRKNTAVYLEARLGIACMKANGAVVERGIKTVAAQGRGVVVEQNEQAAYLA